MLNMGDGTHIHMTFQIDGTVDLDDRQHLLDCYSGIAFGSPAAGNAMPMAMDTYRRRRAA